MSTQPPRLRALKLAVTFLRIGAVAFGGLGATLALIEDELVRKRGVTSKQELTEALTYTKLLPGSTVVQVVAYLGWRLGGWTGSAVATASFLLPSAAVMVALSYGYSLVTRAPAAGSGLRGLLATVAGLLLVTTYRLGRDILTTPLPLILAAAAFGAALFLHLGAAWVVLAAGLVGMLASRR